MSAPANATAVPMPAGAGPGVSGRINLLPDSVRMRLVNRRRRGVWTAIVSVATLIVGLSWQWSRQGKANVDDVRTALANARQRVQVDQKRAVAMAARSAEFQKQLSTFEAMRAGDAWARVLAELAQATPKGAYISRIDVTPVAIAPVPAERKPDSAPPRGESEVRIEGYAAEHNVLAKFLHQLQEPGTFRDIDLLRSTSEPVGSKLALKFGLVCRR